jgi:hypothetical protein
MIQTGIEFLLSKLPLALASGGRILINIGFSRIFGLKRKGNLLFFLNSAKACLF